MMPMSRAFLRPLWGTGTGRLCQGGRRPGLVNPATSQMNAAANTSRTLSETRPNTLRNTAAHIAKHFAKSGRERIAACQTMGCISSWFYGCQGREGLGQDLTLNRNLPVWAPSPPRQASSRWGQASRGCRGQGPQRCASSQTRQGPPV